MGTEEQNLIKFSRKLDEFYLTHFLTCWMNFRKNNGEMNRWIPELSNLVLMYAFEPQYWDKTKASWCLDVNYNSHRVYHCASIGKHCSIYASLLLLSSTTPTYSQFSDRYLHLNCSINKLHCFSKSSNVGINQTKI